MKFSPSEGHGDSNSNERAPERHFPRVGSAVLITNGDQIVLGRRGKQPQFGKWVLPGGKVQPFEPLDAAARREALEETGLKIRITERSGVFEVINEPDEHRLIVYSMAEVDGGRLLAGSDLLEVRWFSRHELDHLDTTPLIRSVLESAGWLSPLPTEKAG
jgi:8-oxo-dGTP diphosphatase